MWLGVVQKHTILLTSLRAWLKGGGLVRGQNVSRGVWRGVRCELMYGRENIGEGTNEHG